MKDIQDVLSVTNNNTKIAQYKNWFFELALDVHEYDLAEKGFIGTMNLVNKNTRIYLEATALLAICYLRTKKYDLAKPFIEDVLKNDKVIKSEKSRRLFNKNIIQRFDEEVALYSLKEENRTETLDYDEIEKEAIFMIQSKNEEEIFENMGKVTPDYTKHLMFEIDNFSKNQLPSAERKLLGSSENLIKDNHAGKMVFSSFKRVIYKTICDSKSTVYNVWHENGMPALLDKKFLVTAIIGSLAEINICIKGLIVSSVALIIKFGLEIYCRKYEPVGVMDSRKIKLK